MGKASLGADYAADHLDEQVITKSSAQTLVPMILESTSITSVVDVGCGLGTWLSVFKDHGVDDIWGIEMPGTDLSRTLIPGNLISSHDLSEILEVTQRYDLALCLEVAEHIMPEGAATLVETLVNLSNVVVFSAAIPSQTGTHHINEQWPAYWWGLFYDQGYVAWDFLRMRVWDDRTVAWWYAQNLVIYTKGGASLSGQPLPGPPAALVHPRCYELWTSRQPSIRGAFRDLVTAGISRVCRARTRKSG